MYGGEGGDHIPSLLERLSEYECSGCYEDALCKTHAQLLWPGSCCPWFAAKLLRSSIPSSRLAAIARTGQHDMVGYEELRRRANRPIGLHHMPLGATTEITQHRMGDFYMLGVSSAAPFALSEAPKKRLLSTTTSARP